MKHVHLVHFEAAAAAEDAARRNYYEEEAVIESFWKKAAASLPPQVQRRYAHLFEAAEQYDPVVDFIVELFRQGHSDRTSVKRGDHREAHA